MLSLLIVDDAKLFRDVARSMLASSNEFKVVAEAQDGAVAVDIYPELRPDVVLMGVQMARMNGLKATREILKHDPEARVVITGMHSDPEYRRRAMATGAQGFIPKPELSASALRDVLDGAVTARDGHHGRTRPSQKKGSQSRVTKARNKRSRTI